MLTLTLLRHAKSSWNSAAASDHERPLNKRGQRDAPRMAAELIKRQCQPTRCLVSTATRTRQTVAAFIEAGVVDASSVEYLDSLYLSSPETILDAVHTAFVSESPSPTHIMVIAHNPGLEILADDLSAYATGAMPTAAIASFSIDAEDFAVVNTANSTLDFYISPKLID